MWKKTANILEIDIAHGERAKTICTFTDSYNFIYLIWDDCRLVLVGNDGHFLTHWPVEVIQEVQQNLTPPVDGDSISSGHKTNYQNGDYLIRKVEHYNS